ncbi:MAG: adenylate/guanylate cyclase domain-containing protein [Rhodospirillales bacterium]
MRFLKRAFSFDRLVGIVMLGAFLVVYWLNPYPVEFMRNKTFDIFQQIKPRDIPAPGTSPITIIDLDEESLSQIGQWPWPRNIIAQMVANLMAMNAIVVGFDIVFAEPDRMNPTDIADSLAGLDEELRNQLRSLKGNDEVFAEVIQRSRVVLGQATYWDKKTQAAEGPVSKSFAIRKLTKTAPDPLTFVPRAPSLVRNIPILENAAITKTGGHGLFSLVPERDGIVRSVPSLMANEGQLFPALTIEMLRVATQRPTVLVEVNDTGIKEIKVAKGLTIETDRHGKMWPYFSLSDKAKYVPAKDVLAGTADPALIQGKLTIVGTSAVGLLDIRAVPTEPVIPGVEVHAQLIEAIVSNQYLTRPNYADGVEIMLIFVGGLLMIILVPWVGAKLALVVFLVIAGSAGGTSWYMFAEHRLLFDAVFAITSILLLYTTLTFTGYAREEAQKRQTRDAFSKYLSPDMVERVAENPDELKLGGEMRDMTLLFCDVRGFTTISEQFDAVGLTSLINKLLTPLTNEILKRRGTVDKYMGDCIMAFWNAPLDDPDHAYNGCISALAMMDQMHPLNERLEKEAEEEGRKHIPLKVGLGLNSGPAVVGNMGSDQRFDYSVLGDTVNTASRLEGQSKSYGMNVVIGPSTNDAVKDRLATIDLDNIQVKGKTSGTLIYGLMGDEEVLKDPKFQTIQQKVHEAMELYRAQKWDESEKLFDELKVLGNDENKPWKIEANLDVLCDVYKERIAEYRENPPPADWNGVYVATSK